VAVAAALILQETQVVAVLVVTEIVMEPPEETQELKVR
jgi:hypothetical protein